MKSESFLLDTHVWLWFLAGSQGVVSNRGWDVIKDAVQSGNAAISDASLWEVAVKSRTLRLEPDAKTFFADAQKSVRIGVIELDRDVLVDSGTMDDAHRDPVDRMLIATAKRYGLTLATADKKILDYAERTERIKVFDVRA